MLRASRSLTAQWVPALWQAEEIIQKTTSHGLLHQSSTSARLSHVWPILRAGHVGRLKGTWESTFRQFMFAGLRLFGSVVSDSVRGDI